MYKGMVAEIAKDVGNNAALILNQIYQWFKTKNVSKVYRTNEEMKEDLCGLLSTATIQRCKKKLIEGGYVVVSFDKGTKRTTHYQLTDKAKALLEQRNEKEAEVVAKASPVTNKSVKPKKEYNYTKPSTDYHDNRPKAMVEEFDNYGKPNPKATVGIPEELKKLFKMKTKPSEQQLNVDENKLQDLPVVIANEEVFGGIQYESDEQDAEISDDEYFGLTDEDWTKMMVCVEEHEQQTIQPEFSLSDLMNKAVKHIPNVNIREQNRMLIDNTYMYKEDY